MQNNFYNYADLTFGVFFREGVLDFLRKGLPNFAQRPFRKIWKAFAQFHEYGVEASFWGQMTNRKQKTELFFVFYSGCVTLETSFLNPCRSDFP